jgi:hypothetical protein
MDYKLDIWPTYAEHEWWRQWATQHVGEFSLLAHWRDDPHQWQILLREKLADLLGLQDTRRPIEVQLLGRQDAHNFSIQKVAFPADDGILVPAYLCVPHDNETPLPAVVLSHDADSSKEAMVGLLAEGNPEAAAGARLAAAGYIVCCLDRRGFGERPRADYASDISAWAGKPEVAADAADLIAACDMLAQRPDVQSRRIGIIGIARGVPAALYAAILHSGFYAIALCGYLGRYRALPLIADRHRRATLQKLFAGTVPAGLLAYADFEDLACLLSPRPLCLYQRHEPDFPMEPATDAARRITEGYALMDEKIKLTAQISDEHTDYPGTTVMDFLDDWLKLPVSPQPPAQN